jgi:tetratricopeptide (TPR) repeat protein
VTVRSTAEDTSRYLSQEDIVPEIALQAYENEIDQLVEQARYLEALAHIRYLLSQHPRYIDAYYLLGKTMLEADLPDLAMDMFRRALSADPGHRMSRIGLGLAHERRNDLDAAIWNLERALELEPGSDEIAEELRRMYGRRDAVELDYVPQTRGGLARLLLRGCRYERAVDELRFLLQEAPARPDLMTALAEAYWRNDQLVQASEMCQELLDKMPYNYWANLLLGTMWVNSGQEEGWIYLKRAQEVDPENQRAVAIFGADSLLEPQEVKLDRLLYDPDAIEVDRENAWFRRLEASSITVGISEAPPEMTEAEVRLVDITASLEAQIEIPDWLRDLGGGDEVEMADVDLGWMADIDLDEQAEASEGEVAAEVPVEALDAAEPETYSLGDYGIEEAAIGALLQDAEDIDLVWLDDLTAAEELAVGEPGDTPDWLRELTGDVEAEAEMLLEPESGVAASQAALGMDGAEAEVSLDWLAAFPDDGDLGDPGAAAATTAEGGEPEDFEELPDWLHELQKNAALSGAPVTGATDVGETEELPDWMAGDTAEIQSSPEALAAGEIPDWLTQLQPESDKVPDWLAALPPADAALADHTKDEIDLVEFEPETLAVEGEALEPVLDEEDLPDWLAQLQGPPGSLDLVDFGIPDEDDGASAAVDEAVGTEAELDEADILDWSRDLEPEVTDDAEAGEADDAIPEWLQALKPPAVETAEAEPQYELTDEELTAWLTVQDVTEEAEPETTPEEARAPREILPADARMGDMLSGDDALAWLESLTIGKEEELRAQAEAESEARVAEILGRKQETPATPVFAEPELEPEPEPEIERAAEATVTELLDEESDLLSGDDALAWLESLTIGKEEELRAQADAESRARVDEILGRKPERAETPALTLPEPEPEIDVELGTPSLDEAEAVSAAPLDAEDLPDAVTEVAPVSPIAPMLMEADSSAGSRRGDVEHGEDALAWLERLTSEEEQALRAQVEEASPDEVGDLVTADLEEGYFGWVAFGGAVEEVMPTVPEAAAAEVTEPETGDDHVPEAAGEPVRVEPTLQEAPVSVKEQALEAPLHEPQLTKLQEAPVDASEPVLEAPLIEPQLPRDVEQPVSAPSDGLTEDVPVSTTAEEQLDELRALVKRKRSDHASRLQLARLLFTAGEVQESMQNYARLIKSGAKMDEVMEDLERYLQEKPEESTILRALGDAHMKFGELEKALEFYNRAMALL